MIHSLTYIGLERMLTRDDGNRNDSMSSDSDPGEEEEG